MKLIRLCFKVESIFLMFEVDLMMLRIKKFIEYIGFKMIESIGKFVLYFIFWFWRVCSVVMLILFFFYWLYGGVVSFLLLIVVVFGVLYYY